MSLSRNSSAYCPSPSPSSQSVISVEIAGIRDHQQGRCRAGRSRPLAFIAEIEALVEDSWENTKWPPITGGSIAASAYVTEAIRRNRGRASTFGLEGTSILFAISAG
jgi:hypothetical protein